MRDRTNEKWTKEQKEWMGYKRKLANLSKDSVSLSKPPWDEKPEQIKEDKEKNQRGLPRFFYDPVDNPNNYLYYFSRDIEAGLPLCPTITIFGFFFLTFPTKLLFLHPVV